MEQNNDKPLIGPISELENCLRPDFTSPDLSRAPEAFKRATRGLGAAVIMLADTAGKYAAPAVPLIAGVYKGINAGMGIDVSWDTSTYAALLLGPGVAHGISYREDLTEAAVRGGIVTAGAPISFTFGYGLGWLGAKAFQ